MKQGSEKYNWKRNQRKLPGNTYFKKIKIGAILLIPFLILLIIGIVISNNFFKQ